MAQNSPVKKRTILIICRGLSEIPLLSPIKPEPQYRYVIASDDIRVQELVRQYPWVDDVCWIEQMESFYEVASDVITIVEAVNRWLKLLSNNRIGMPADLLFWIRHAEGGKTTQRIQDVLLLIRSYLHLFDTYDVERVVLLRDNPCWEDDVLIQTARSRGIRIQRVGFFNRNKGLKYRIKGLIIRAINYSKYLLRIPYHVYRIYKIIQVKYQQRRKLPVPTCSKEEIVFQLCGSLDYHVEDIVPLMKALREKGYKPVALTWRATDGAEKVRQQGLHAEELEEFIPDWVSWEVPYRVLYTRLKAKKRIKQFFNLPELEYQSVPLGALLWASVQYFLTSELAMWYKLDQALKEYFKYHKPVAIKLWGGISLYEGAIAWKNLNPTKRPFLFDYFVGVALVCPYCPKQDPTDLFLAVGPIHREEYLRRYGFSSGEIVLVGQARYGHLTNWLRTYRRETSRSYLNIPSGYSIYVFFDPSYLLRGYLTTREQVLVTNTLLNFAKEHSSVALIMKPHPMHKTGILEHIVEQYSSPNVFLVDKSMLPYHALNAADLAITKVSTIGIEAMLLGKPVICCILDGEERWKLYRYAAEYVQTVDSLTGLLVKIFEDAEFRSQWTEIRLKEQNRLLKQYFGEQSQPAAVLASEAIASRLKRRTLDFHRFIVNGPSAYE